MISHIFKLIWNKKKSNAFIILEIFLAFIVLFFVLSYYNFNMDKVNTPLGFETEDRWAIMLDNVEMKDSVEIVSDLTNLKRNLESMEEIEAASFALSMFPFSSSTWHTGTDVNGFQVQTRVVPCDVNLKDALGLNVIDGRWYQEEDLHATPKPLVINKEFIDRYYPGESRIDSVFLWDDETYKIIGVIDYYRYHGEFSEAYPTLMELRDYLENQTSIMVKVKPGTPIAAQEQITKMVNQTTNKNGTIILDLDKQRVNDSRESWILLIALLAISGFLCLNVALGLFGVLWYTISKRKSEIGLRQALGAGKMSISRQFIFETLFLALIAIILGTFFVIQVPLLKVTEYPDDIFYRAIVMSAMIIIALVFICSLIPSIQASKIAPATALHQD